MNILLLGDIMGPSGRKAIIEKLPGLIRKKKIDFVILNGENAGDGGVGITKKIFSEQMAQARRNRAAEYKLQEIARRQAEMRPGAKYVSGEAAAADKYNPATREPEGQLQTPTTNFGPGAMRWT